MRKLFAIFIICATILYSVLLCYAGEADSLQQDLPLASKYEIRQTLEQLNALNAEGAGIFAEQQLNLNILEGFYYLGYDHTNSFDGSSLYRALNWSGGLAAEAPIYRSEIYQGYYKARTEKLLKEYSNSHFFNSTAFIKTARADFDNYIKATIKDDAGRKQLVIMLQEKLLDKLPELEPSKRRAVLDEIFSLRLPANKVLCNDYIYQVLESRVRVELLTRMLEINKDMLIDLASDIPIRITANKSGSLLLQYKNQKGEAEAIQVLNAAKESGSFSGFTVLYELYDKKDSSLIFIDDKDIKQEVDINSVFKAISLDNKGYLLLELDSLLEKRTEEGTNLSKTEVPKLKDAQSDENQMKALEAAYYSKAAEVQGITRELNRYGIYLELKSKGISNYYTRKFEADKKTWKASLDAKLYKFSPGGMADFAAYIKQLVLFSRSDLGQSEKGKVLTARYRNSIVQFRQPDDSSMWITDMLYNLKYMN